MRQAAALAAIALVALTFQGALAAVVPEALVPDFGLLVVVSGAVALPPVSGLLLAAGVGYGADLLSGSLLGQHGLLRVVAFAATLVVSAQFQLRRGLALFAFVAGLAVADSLLLGLLGRVFQPESPLGVAAAGAIAVRALATAALAPWAASLFGALRDRLLEGEARRREVRLETRRPVL